LLGALLCSGDSGDGAEVRGRERPRFMRTCADHSSISSPIWGQISHPRIYPLLALVYELSAPDRRESHRPRSTGAVISDKMATIMEASHD
jgi:hypothetical protein